MTTAGCQMRSPRIKSCLLLTLTVFLAGCVPRSPSDPRTGKTVGSFAQLEPGSLPDRRLTPGNLREVTRDDICAPGYTKRVREVPIRIRRRVYERYERRRENGICCELDHLIPLELGGSNREQNLWPEPYNVLWNARAKDRLEGRLHKLVCDGSIDLATAQREIASDWIAAYRKYIGPMPSTAGHPRR